MAVGPEASEAAERCPVGDLLPDAARDVREGEQKGFWEPAPCLQQ